MSLPPNEVEVDQKRIDELWFSFQTVPGAAFKLNDSVSVEAGELKGERGNVVALLALRPEPRYLVELSSGSDAEIAESELSRVD